MDRPNTPSSAGSELRAGTICYINTDLYTNGRFDAGGVPSLRDFLVDVTKDVAEGASASTTRGAPTSGRVSRAERRRRGSGRLRGRAESARQRRRLRPVSGFPRAADAVDRVQRRPADTATAPIIPTTTRGGSSSTSPTPGFVAGRSWRRVLGTSRCAWRVGGPAVSFFALRAASGPIHRRRPAWTLDDEGRMTVAVDVDASRRPRSIRVRRAAALERQIDDGLASGRLPAPTTATLNDLLARLEQRLLDESEPPDVMVSPRDLRMGHLLAVRRPAFSAACRSDSLPRCRARGRGSRAHRRCARPPRPGTPRSARTCRSLARLRSAAQRP